MSVNKIATRYAKSLLDLAEEKGQIKAVNQDIEQFSEVLKNRDFYLLIKSPIVNTTKKMKILKEIFGDKFSVITNSFLDIVVRKRRESYLPEIVNSFKEQYKAKQGIVNAHLTTASPINDDLISKVRGIILLDTGKSHVDLETQIDPSLIGGFILQFEDKLYDSSVAHKLDKLKKGFDENKYIKKY